jgi:hypothetical protein
MPNATLTPAAAHVLALVQAEGARSAVQIRISLEDAKVRICPPRSPADIAAELENLGLAKRSYSGDPRVSSWTLAAV